MTHDGVVITTALLFGMVNSNKEEWPNMGIIYSLVETII